MLCSVYHERLSRPNRGAPRPKARYASGGRPANRPGARPVGPVSSGRAAGRARSCGNGWSRSRPREQVGRVRRATTRCANAARVSLPTAKPLRYQATCLRNSVHARVPRRATRRAVRRVGASLGATSPQIGSRASGRPVNAAARSANSHGRPRQPRPTTTPAQPVSRDHPQRVVGLPDVAVAEHRDVQQLGQLGDRRPVGLPAVEVGSPSARAGPHRPRPRPARAARLRGKSDGRRRCRAAS